MKNDLDTVFGSPHLPHTPRQEFNRWPAQIHRELSILLSDKSEAWLRGATEQIELFLKAKAPGFRTDLELLHKPHPARSIEGPYMLLLERPGSVTLFSAWECTVDWRSLNPFLEQWERFAAFSLVQVNRCIALLEEGEQASEAKADAIRRLDEAGGCAMEAMRALQIAHSLRGNSQQRTVSASEAAKARHARSEPYKNRAIANTLAREFPSMVKAVDYLTENEPIDEEGKKFASRRSAEQWLRKAGFKPTKKRPPSA